MDIKQAIVTSLTQGDFVVNAYLADLTSPDLLVRALPGSNHIAWQLGHLISAERNLVNRVAPDVLEPLSPEFEARHKKETAGIDDAAAFYSKEEYDRLAKQVRAGTLKVVAEADPALFDQPVAKMPPMVKTVGDLFLFINMHWLMHTGQWVMVRRKLGRPPLF